MSSMLLERRRMETVMVVNFNEIIVELQAIAQMQKVICYYTVALIGSMAALAVVITWKQ